MAPAVQRDQRTAPKCMTWAPSWLWDAEQVRIYSEPPFSHLEHIENILYLTSLPRTEGFPEMQDFQC